MQGSLDIMMSEQITISFVSLYVTNMEVHTEAFICWREREAEYLCACNDCPCEYANMTAER
jgi:hypothetical protein